VDLRSIRTQLRLFPFEKACLKKFYERITFPLKVSNEETKAVFIEAMDDAPNLELESLVTVS
jgi:hypothetical protein